MDEKNLIVTAPAFMYEGNFYEVSQSVDAMVKGVVGLLETS